MTHSDAPVRPDDLWTLLLCTVRYAMGRQTYIVSLAGDMVRRYGGSLRPEQVAQIGREIRDALAFEERLGRTLGADMDHREWQRLASELGGVPRQSDSQGEP